MAEFKNPNQQGGGDNKSLVVMMLVMVAVFFTFALNGEVGHGLDVLLAFGFRRFLALHRALLRPGPRTHVGEHYSVLPGMKVL